jgi:hypothetical protein
LEPHRLPLHRIHLKVVRIEGGEDDVCRSVVELDWFFVDAQSQFGAQARTPKQEKAAFAKRLGARAYNFSSD